MNKRIDEICSHPPSLQSTCFPGRPAAQPIQLAAAYECASPAQADALLGGRTDGYVYQRDGHPNADVFSRQCRELHCAEDAVITASGMSALALAVVSFLEQDDELVVSDRLYGRSSRLFQQECTRFGINTSVVNALVLDEVAASCSSKTRMIVVETISNPLLKVADLSGLSQISKARNALLLVDNTFASPAVCRPILMGADLVMESVSKMMNGHSDLMLGMLCGRSELIDRAKTASATWGFTSAPYECWLASRGLATFHLRIERACRNALSLAELLNEMPQVEEVFYPGLSQHSDHLRARELFGEESVQRFQQGGISEESARQIMFGNMVTFRLKAGADNTASRADRLIELLDDVRFVPSLGGIETTISHPSSTSHRHLDELESQKLGICPATIRISVGIESEEFVKTAFRDALNALDG